MSPGYVSWYQSPSPMPTPSIKFSIWLFSGCWAMGGLCHESMGFVFLLPSTICETSPPPEAIAFRFAPRAAVAPAPNDLWPRAPRGMAPEDDGNWWYMKSAWPRPWDTHQHTWNNKPWQWFSMINLATNKILHWQKWTHTTVISMKGQLRLRETTVCINLNHRNSLFIYTEYSFHLE